MPFLDWLFIDEEGHVLWGRAILVAGVILIIDFITMVVGPPRLTITDDTGNLIGLAIGISPLVIMIGIFGAIKHKL